VYKAHPFFECPEDETIIWKYIDLWKLKALLDDNAFYLRRADALVELDQFEGGLQPAYNECISKQIFSPDFHKYMMKLKVKSIDDIEICGNRYWDLKEMRKRFDKIYEYFLSNIFVTYWHINNEENKEMWTEYIKEKPGIAIVSTVGKLKKALEVTDLSVNIANVAYIDWENNDVDYNIVFCGAGVYSIILQMLFNKTTAFKKERELRLLYTGLPDEQIYGTLLGGKFDLTHKNNEISFLLPIGINDLIDKIYLSPGSSLDFKNEVSQLIFNHIEGFESDKIVFSKFVA
jgi:hypothetical protein